MRFITCPDPHKVRKYQRNGMSGNALLVIDGLLWTPEQKPKRPSVLLIPEGFESYRENFGMYFGMYYANFRKVIWSDTF